MSTKLEEIERQLKEISDYLHKGDDITYPLSVLSAKLDDIESRVTEHSKIYNKVVYMFVTLLCAVIVKTFIQYFIG